MLKKVLIGVGILFVILIIVSINSASDRVQEVVENNEIETQTAQTKTEKEQVEPVVEIATLYGKSMSELASQYGVALNQVGNLIFENEDYKLLVESKNGATSDYVEVQLKSLGSCNTGRVQSKADDALELVALKPGLKGSPTNPQSGINIGAVEYCEYPNNRYAVGVSCMYDGGFYDVSLSPRTYCN